MPLEAGLILIFSHH